MQYWGDTWGSGTTFEAVTGGDYAKTFKLTSGNNWGVDASAAAWGNEPENAIDISSYTHARFKVMTSDYTKVKVSVQSHSQDNSEIVYSLSDGTSLDNGWIEMEVPLPAFTDMTWFGLVFDGAGTVNIADIEFITRSAGTTNTSGDAYIAFSGKEDTFSIKYWGDTWGSGTTISDLEDEAYAKAFLLTSGNAWTVDAAAMAWGNDKADAVDIAPYTHARFKVSSSDYESVRVSIVSARWPANNVTYPLSTGTSLGNGWVEMEVPLPNFPDMKAFGLVFEGGAGTAKLADVYFTTKDTDDAGECCNTIGGPTGGESGAAAQGTVTDQAYIAYSGQDDTFSMAFWGDVWGSDTTVDALTDDQYAKTWLLTNGAGWGISASAIAWGNSADDALDISAHTHARFKVKSAEYKQVRVSTQSATQPASEVFYDLTTGSSLENGWVQMEVPLPDFTDMVWFGLVFEGYGQAKIADIEFITRTVESGGSTSSAAYIAYSGKEDSFNFPERGATWDSGSSWTELTDDQYAKTFEITSGGNWGANFGVMAWGGFTAETAIDVSSYSHLRFKVLTNAFTDVEVSMQSATQPEQKPKIALSTGTALENGWLSVEAPLADFSDLTWLGLIFHGEGTMKLADVELITK
ncbi:hypothetical protein CS022_06640 [Veronia nyctiphanis]|uniref:Uncharacterized protein n=1 Tax=Veronia nyctiphanis TaxID=1278244 RepID=A0A4Q0YTB9_9GAMM|nr:hypothetical protein [Veronia nyctiphanis]RXJ73953.1 hypothetical protein CS022_06640 [Veronia nyctiphanis]